MHNEHCYVRIKHDQIYKLNKCLKENVDVKTNFLVRSFF